MRYLDCQLDTIHLFQLTFCVVQIQSGVFIQRHHCPGGVISFIESYSLWQRRQSFARVLIDFLLVVNLISSAE
jgi:hypothetical protein